MIPKRSDDISESDLIALISNGVSEGRTIEYKRELPGNSDGDKKEFLADASSFANTSGGDLIFGIDESQGLPTQLTGFQSADADLEIRRLDSILVSGIDPRIRYLMKLVTCDAGKKVLVLRLDRSWSGPHRVIFKGYDKFYGRGPAGKYPLDVNQLRAAFTLSSTVTERIRAFRTDRIIAVSNNQTPVPFTDDPKIVLHCIPMDSFTSQRQYDILPYFDNPARLRPMVASGWNRRLNLEGVVSFAVHDLAYSYTQLYRNGIIEAVLGGTLAHEYQGKLVIPSVSYEQYVFQFLPFCFQVLQEIGANTPIVVGLTLTKTRGLLMGVESVSFQLGHAIQEDTIILPEAIVEDFSTPPGQILKPLFDLVWNASGYPSSKNFDGDGNWINRR